MANDQKAMQAAICSALLDAFPMADKVADNHAAVAIKAITAYLAASTPAKPVGELVERLRPRHIADEPLARAVVSNDQMERRRAVEAYLISNNALKSEAVAALTTLTAERDALRKLAGLGCDAREGGMHNVVKQGAYTFCSDCGETLTQVDLRERCRLAEAALSGAK